MPPVQPLTPPGIYTYEFIYLCLIHTFHLGNSKTVVIVPAGSTKTIPQSILDLKGSIDICTSDWLVESLLTGSLAPTQHFSI